MCVISMYIQNFSMFKFIAFSKFLQVEFQGKEEMVISIVLISIYF